MAGGAVLLGAAALGASVAVPASIASPAPLARAAAESPPAPIEIGTLPGGADSQAVGINSSGEVVGWSNVNGNSTPTVVHAFSWTKSGGLVDLQSTVGLGGHQSIAFEVSDTGQIVGSSLTSSGAPHAFSWAQAGGLVDLGTLPGDSQSGATSVNGSGQVVGWAAAAHPQSESAITHAFSWTEAGGMTDLGTFGGPTAAASAVSSSGTVVGYSDDAAGDEHAFSWTPTGHLVDLGTLGGTTSAAYAISANGQQITGQSTTNKGEVHAFSWTKSYGMLDLLTLGGKSSVALGVNDNGQVVGYSSAASGSDYGFAWSQLTGMVELPPLHGDIASEAIAINDDGQVVGWSKDAAGDTRAVLWQLPPLPVAAKISGLKLTPASFRARRHGSAIASRGKKGTKLRFRLSVHALVTFKLERAMSGRRHGNSCLPDTRARANERRCTRYVSLRGSFKHSGNAGKNTFWFTGVFRNAPLKPGRYHMIATARAGSGPVSAPIRANFTIKG